jgi:acyl dehydratase
VPATRRPARIVTGLAMADIVMWVVVSVFVELVLIVDVVVRGVRFVDVLLCVCRGRRQEWRSQKQGGVT